MPKELITFFNTKILLRLDRILSLSICCFKHRLTELGLKSEETIPYIGIKKQKIFLRFMDDRMMQLMFNRVAEK